MTETLVQPTSRNISPPWTVPFVRTKVVATFGPACSAPDRMNELLRSGVDVVRINMAHGTPEFHDLAVQTIREAAERTGRIIAILADLSGPKMRLGDLPGGAVTLVDGGLVRFVRGDIAGIDQLTTTYEPLLDELSPGDRIMLADGAVCLVVESVSNDAAVCRVVQGGMIRGQQGINLPGVRLSAPAMDDDDRRHARWAAERGLDFVGLSFVRSPEEVRELKEMLIGWGSTASVIAKIEKQEALDELDSILDAADGAMVARGDLGVEIDIARVPMAQKRIVAACNARQKPVIIATQMLDSMQRSRWPTRAEATDVANAIMDGADACMLSGETAIGDHPVDAVRMLHRIAHATEEVLAGRAEKEKLLSHSGMFHPVTQAIVCGASEIAEQLQAKLIVVASQSGATVLALSKYRGFVPIIGASDAADTLRKMCLYWGVIPIPQAPTHFIAEILGFVDHFCRERAGLAPGDRVVVVTGSGASAIGHNIVVVHEIED